MIFKIEPVGYADGLDTGLRENHVKDYKTLDLSNWQVERAGEGEQVLGGSRTSVGTG